MKVNIQYVKIITICTLLVVVLNQMMWIYNMYQSYQKELKLYINDSLEKSIYEEFTDRINQLGGYFFSNIIPNTQDTARFIQRKITTADTILFVLVDKYDSHATDKVNQFVLKKDLPININLLDSLFHSYLAEKFPIERTYVDYLDLKEDSLLASNKPEYFSSGSSVASAVFPLDILDSIGVRAYVESPVLTILKKMLYQLILSIVLIVFASVCLVYLARTIFIQRKEEKMRQDSINAMTHEFKRPISVAVAKLKLMPYYLETENRERVEEYANGALLELEKLTSYTERIQQISNNEKSKIQLNKSDIEIQPFFSQLKEQYASDAKSFPIGIDVKIETKKSIFSADLLHFSNVMDNLIENAIKYAKEGGVEIEVSIQDANQALLIKVKDNGLGISTIDKNHIFDKYYRSKSKETRHKKGFGLGLTYVKSIVEAHKGSISVESRLHQGSEFVIRL